VKEKRKKKIRKQRRRQRTGQRAEVARNLSLIESQNEARRRTKSIRKRKGRNISSGMKRLKRKKVKVARRRRKKGMRKMKK